jgi:hypothetical protein
MNCCIFNNSLSFSPSLSLSLSLCRPPVAKDLHWRRFLYTLPITIHLKQSVNITSIPLLTASAQSVTRHLGVKYIKPIRYMLYRYLYFAKPNCD